MKLAPISSIKRDINKKIINAKKIKQKSNINFSKLNTHSSNQSNIGQTKIMNMVLGGGAVVAAILGTVLLKKNSGASKYVKSLTKSLNAHFNTQFKPEALKSVISGKELLAELKNLKRENYVATVENLRNGTFIADLHSHSNFSDGQGQVRTILNQVAEYADFLNKKNGKKFIFSLTDHDVCDGVRYALKIIAETPEKFKNVRFVTGSEISFAMKSDKTSNAFETAEVLVYGFNPFDKNIMTFFDSIKSKRKHLTKNFIQELNNRFGYADFSYEEFKKIFLSDTDNMLMNNQWLLHHYGQTKNAISGLANMQNKDKAQLYEELMSQLPSGKKNLWQLRDRGLVPQSFGDDDNIIRLCKEVYSPHYLENDAIEYSCENNFNDIVSIFEKDKNTFFAMAHPYYITERSNDTLGLIKDLKARSRGLLKASESYHQAYGNNVDLNEVRNFDDTIHQSMNLLKLGGRDNHEVNWLDIAYK